MSNWYDRSPVIIDSSGILAESISASSKNSVEGLRALGRKGIVGRSAQGPNQTSISVDYYLEPGNEPNYNRLQSWKEDLITNNYSPLKIEVMGITGSGWIDRYSVKSTINSPAKVSVSYTVYGEMSGVNSTGITVSLDQTQTSGIGHGWSTYLLPNNEVTELFSDFEYSCSLNWKPFFVLGNKTPIQMQLINATETMSLSRNSFLPITFSGQPANEFYNGITGLEINGLEAMWGNDTSKISFSISGAPVTTSDFSLSNNGYLVVKSSITKYF